jgi:hypothetical protein
MKRKRGMTRNVSALFFLCTAAALLAAPALPAAGQAAAGQPPGKAAVQEERSGRAASGGTQSAPLESAGAFLERGSIFAMRGRGSFEKGSANTENCRELLFFEEKTCLCGGVCIRVIQTMQAGAEVIQ